MGWEELPFDSAKRNSSLLSLLLLSLRILRVSVVAYEYCQDLDSYTHASVYTHASGEGVYSPLACEREI